MAKLRCAVCGYEMPVPATGGFSPLRVLSAGIHGEAIPGPDPAILYCRCADPDHEIPMPRHCDKYMVYVAEE